MDSWPCVLAQFGQPASLQAFLAVTCCAARQVQGLTQVVSTPGMSVCCRIPVPVACCVLLSEGMQMQPRDALVASKLSTKQRDGLRGEKCLGQTAVTACRLRAGV